MKQIFTFLIIVFNTNLLFSQVGITVDGSSPDASAMLEVKSTSAGFLPPRMSTTQINAIPSPAVGLMVFDTSTMQPVYFDGTSWRTFYYTFGESCGTVNYGAQSYNTVIIGNQCWMKENLNIGTRIASNQDQTDNDTIEKYCWDDDSLYCVTYGGLYQWDEMMQYTTQEGTQGICPDGWHVPSDGEWDILVNYLGGSSVAGGKLKETGTTHWVSPNTGATNESGYTGLPDGYRDSGGIYNYLGYLVHFWTSTEYDGSYAWYRGLSYNNANVDRSKVYKVYGSPVRCLKD